MLRWPLPSGGGVRREWEDGALAPLVRPWLEQPRRAHAARRVPERCDLL